MGSKIDTFLALTPSNTKKVSDFLILIFVPIHDGKHQYMSESHTVSKYLPKHGKEETDDIVVAAGVAG